MLILVLATATWLSRLCCEQQEVRLVKSRAGHVSEFYLNLKRDPSRVKSLWLALPVVGWRSRKKAWLSTAHFHRFLQLLALDSWNKNVCSCSRPWKSESNQIPPVSHLETAGQHVSERVQTWSSSSTTTNVSRLFLKSKRVILGLNNKEIENYFQPEAPNQQIHPQQAYM